MKNPHEHISDDGSVAFRVRRGLMLHVYFGRATAAHLPPLERVSDDAILGPRALQLMLIQPHSVKDVPDDEFRAGAAARLKQGRHQFVGVAVVIAVEGFVGAIARSVMTGVSWLSDVGERQRTFHTVDEATPWLVGRAPDLGISTEDVAAEVAALAADLAAKR